MKYINQFTNGSILNLISSVAQPISTIKTLYKIFPKIRKNGYIKERETEQFFCNKDSIFLADRYVIGECPECQSIAKGDQCENCSKLLNPIDLINPKCIICKSKPVLKKTNHLYIDLPKIKTKT